MRRPGQRYADHRAGCREGLPLLGEGGAKMRDCAKFGIMRYRREFAELAQGAVAVTASGVNYIVIHQPDPAAQRGTL